MKFYNFILGLHDLNTNVTTANSEGNHLLPEMKTFYDTELLRMVEAKMVHNQFGQKRPIPKNGGKSIEFRKYASLGKALDALDEGVTPNGQKLDVTTITANVAQYGGYVTISDMLDLTAIDKNLQEATRLIANQAAATLDTITRDIINSGTVWVPAKAGVLARHLLVGGSATATDNAYLNVDAIKRAVRELKNKNAPTDNGYYIGIIHPDCAYDLMKDPEWKYPHQYKDTMNLYNGEIGQIAGVRFVETTEAKKFVAKDLASDSRTLAINNADGYSGAITSVAFDGGTVAGSALVGREIVINGVKAKITANTASALTFASTNFGTIVNDAVIYPGEAGASGRDVYSTLILGSDAYGVTNIEGGGLEYIIKQLGSAGTGDPLNQRATSGWKATAVAEILYDPYMCRIESTSTYNDNIAN